MQEIDGVVEAIQALRDRVRELEAAAAVLPAMLKPLLRELAEAERECRAHVDRWTGRGNGSAAQRLDEWAPIYRRREAAIEQLVALALAVQTVATTSTTEAA